MPNRKNMHSEETRRAILLAAGKLFANQGYDAVTIRQIAKEAQCSHTTIYIYFKDKEALLHHLSMDPLRHLYSQLSEVVLNTKMSPYERVREMTRRFIDFCFLNRNMYAIFFMTRASRVDEEKPVLEIQKLRNELFGLLHTAIMDCLPVGTGDELVLAYARIHFYALHGMIATYLNSEEPLDAIQNRLMPTFDLAVDVLLEGFVSTVTKEAKRS